MSAEDQWNELRAEMQDFFNEFDYNKTGKLGVEEITAILKSVGLRCAVEEVREMMSVVAGPTATSIDFNQLMEILKSHTHQEDEEEMVKQAFNTIDVDGDGFISPQDLQCFMQSLGEDFDIKYAERMLRHAKDIPKKDADKYTRDDLKIDLETYKKQLDSYWVKEATKASEKE